LALRAKIVLACAEGQANQQVAEQLGVWPQTVGKWRGRFVRQRLEGLSDEARPGRPRTITDTQVEQVITKTLEEPPPRHDTHWSTRSMARATGMSQTAISRIWRAFGLKPHLTESWKLSTDPQFLDKVRDLVGLYLDPPERALVLGVDEKSQIQALDRTQPGLPIKKGRCGTMTHDYKRNGTATLFAAMNALDGTVISMCDDRHRHQEWLKFLRVIDEVTPDGQQIHLIADNYATHKHPKVQRWLARHPRFHIYFTPTSSSWLNMVERFFRDITQNRIRRGIFRDVEELIMAIGEYIDKHNDNPKPFVWSAKAADILEKVKRARKALDIG
jgi:transposase